MNKTNEDFEREYKHGVVNPKEYPNWQALQAFYKLKSLLLPDFIKRNKRTLNLLEDLLMREYKNL